MLYLLIFMNRYPSTKRNVPLNAKQLKTTQTIASYMVIKDYGKVITVPRRVFGREKKKASSHVDVELIQSDFDLTLKPRNFLYDGAVNKREPGG